MRWCTACICQTVCLCSRNRTTRSPMPDARCAALPALPVVIRQPPRRSLAARRSGSEMSHACRRVGVAVGLPDVTRRVGTFCAPQRSITNPVAWKWASDEKIEARNPGILLARTSDESTAKKGFVRQMRGGPPSNGPRQLLRAKTMAPEKEKGTEMTSRNVDTS